MVGRIDDRHKEDPNYVYLIGSDKLSTELHNLSEEINKKYTNINLDYKYNDEKDPNTPSANWSGTADYPNMEKRSIVGGSIQECVNCGAQHEKGTGKILRGSN